jgi:hypothetical protein
MWPLCDHYVELIGILCFVSQCFACGLETQLRSGSYCTHIAQKHHHGDLPNQKQMKHTEKKNPNRNMCWTRVEHSRIIQNQQISTRYFNGTSC